MLFHTLMLMLMFMLSCFHVLFHVRTESEPTPIVHHIFKTMALNDAWAWISKQGIFEKHVASTMHFAGTCIVWPY